MNYIYIGKIVNTHGIKGELRIISDFPYKDQVFKSNTKIYIGKKKELEIIEKYRFHKIFDMIVLKGHYDINEVLPYKGKDVYIDREETKIEGMLEEDYIGLNVYSNNVLKGIIIGILKGVKQENLIIENNNKKYYVPKVDAFIKKIDLENKTIEIEEIEGLFDEN